MADFPQSYRDAEAVLSPQVVKDCVEGILSEVARRLPTPAADLTVLDVGCGSGAHSFELAKRVRRVVGVEPDAAAYAVAINRQKSSSARVEFYHGLIEQVELNEKFDLAISLTTVEHMPSARDSFIRVLDCLKPGGIIYLTAPNRLWPIECHYSLPFLSWLPLPLANLYLRITGKGHSYEDCSYMKTYWGMKKLFDGLNCHVHFVLPDKDNTYIGVGDTSRWGRWVRNTGIELIRRFPSMWAISKAFLMVIEKPQRPL